MSCESSVILKNTLLYRILGDSFETTFFSETEGKTRIKTDSNVNGKGMMMRSMFALMELLGGAFQSQEVKNIEALKKVIEENRTDYYPTSNVVEEEEIEVGENAK